MEIYRLGLTIYARQLSGEGAKLHGGRWNHIGHPCIYAAASKALCVLEFAANVSLDELPEDLSFTTYELPREACRTFSPAELPEDWMATPAPDSTKAWGTAQLQMAVALKVPSVVIPSEYNFVLNPLHVHFAQVRLKGVERFIFDKRIKK